MYSFFVKVEVVRLRASASPTVALQKNDALGSGRLSL